MVQLIVSVIMVFVSICYSEVACGEHCHSLFKVTATVQLLVLSIIMIFVSHCYGAAAYGECNYGFL